MFKETDAERIAFMGGAYGNVPALRACIEHARARDCALVFLGDATGCCGHSEETLALIRSSFDVWISGNHEQEAVTGSNRCGCGYDDVEDERYACMAHAYAMESLREDTRRWLAEWPHQGVLATRAGRVLLCHGSPDRTNEFLYQSELDPVRLSCWLDAGGAVALACTHTGIPWVRALPGGRLALNCGAVGKPDHDGDPAVHYGLMTVDRAGVQAHIERVAYDAESWADQLGVEGVDWRFTEPLRTGWWTVGVRSLPEWERSVRSPSLGSRTTR